LNGVEIAIPVMKDVTARVTIEGQQQGGFTLTNQGVTAGNVVYFFRQGAGPLELALTDAAGDNIHIGSVNPTELSECFCRGRTHGEADVDGFT